MWSCSGHRFGHDVRTAAKIYASQLHAVADDHHFNTRLRYDLVQHQRTYIKQRRERNRYHYIARDWVSTSYDPFTINVLQVLLSFSALSMFLVACWPNFESLLPVLVITLGVWWWYIDPHNALYTVYNTLFRSIWGGVTLAVSLGLIIAFGDLLLPSVGWWVMTCVRIAPLYIAGCCWLILACAASADQSETAILTLIGALMAEGTLQIIWGATQWTQPTALSELFWLNPNWRLLGIVANWLFGGLALFIGAPGIGLIAMIDAGWVRVVVSFRPGTNGLTHEF